MRYHMLMLITLVVALLAVPCNSFGRRWEDATGKFSIEADFVRLRDDIVSLRKADGSVIQVPLNKLCNADQHHIRSVSLAPAEARTHTASSLPSIANDFHRRNTVEAGRAVTVIAEGAGATPDEALKDAFRNAVRQVVGAVVDAETLVNNDEIISDQVLTYSDGFIKAYEELTGSQEPVGGLHRVKIRAQVERRSIIAKLTAASVTIKTVDGKSLFAEAVTTLEAENNAAALLKKQLNEFPQSCLRVTVIGKPEIVEKAVDRVTARITIQIEPDLQAYSVFSAKLLTIVGGLATRKGEFQARFREYKEVATPSTMIAASRLVPSTVYTMMPRGGTYPGETEAAHVESTLPAWLSDLFTRDGQNPLDTTILAVAVRRTQKSDRIDYQYFVLDKSLRSELVAVATRGGEATLRMLDGNGKTVTTEHFRTDSLVTAFQANAQMILRLSGGKTRHDDYDLFAPTAGIFFVNNVFVYSDMGDVKMFQRPAITVPIDLDLSLDELKSIQSAKCEISFDQ